MDRTAEIDALRRRLASAEADLRACAAAEAALRASEQTYRMLFESIDEGFCVVEVLLDDAGRAVDLLHLEANEAYERYTGLSGIVGRRAREIVPEGGPWLDFYGDIALTGRPARYESYLVAPVDRWIAAYASRIGGEGSLRVAIVFNDVTERKRAEERLRASEERQAFLLTLSDALQPLADAAEIQATTTRLLGTHLGADRAMYAEVEGEPGSETGTIRGQYVRSARGGEPAAVPFPERFAYRPFGEESMAGRYRGDLLIVPDIAAAPGFEAAERAAWAADGVRAAVVAPLVKDGRLVAEFGVHSAMPRPWTEAETALVRDVAERTWAAAQRARAEAALRESEERQRLTVELVPALLWWADPEGRDIAVNHRWKSYTGQNDAGIRDGGWFDAIHPDDLEATRAAFAHAFATGEPIERQQRIRRGDGEQRWHLVRQVPIRDARGAIARWFGAAIDIQDLRALQVRQEVLVGELQHRARNLLGIVAAIADRTVKQGGAVEAFEERLQALGRAQGLLSRFGSDTVEVGALVRMELAAHAEMASPRIAADGPRVFLTARQVQNFALALHELATNAVKYGALKGDDGRLAIAWNVVPDGRRRLDLSWVESGVAVDPGAGLRRGYGTELIREALAYALEAQVEYELGRDGVRCRIVMPIG